MRDTKHQASEANESAEIPTSRTTTERLDAFVFTVTSQSRSVETSTSTVRPAEADDFGLLDFWDGDRVADGLRVVVNADSEPRYEIRRFAEREDANCAQRQVAGFAVRGGGDRWQEFGGQPVGVN
jgi:hypothetical protein